LRETAVWGRIALIGVIVLILEIVGAPAVTYSAATKKHEAHCTARSCKPKANKKRCNKGQVRKNGKCLKKATPPSPGTPETTSTPEALSATLIVHVYKTSGTGTEPDEGAPLFVAKHGSAPSARGFETSEHTLHVTPGEYEITALEMTNPTTVALAPRTVMVSTGETKEVTLTIP
jgi:hypothetical protein